MSTKEAKRQSFGRFIIVCLFLALLLTPALYVINGLEEQSHNNFERLLNRSNLEIRHELMKFKLDLVPENLVENVIRRVDQLSGLVATGEASIDLSGDPQIYNEAAFHRILEIFKTRYQIEPLYLALYSPDMYDVYSYAQPDLQRSLTKKQQDFLKYSTGTLVSRTAHIIPVSDHKDAAEKFLERREIVRQGKKHLEHTVALKMAFTELAFVPRVNGITFAMMTERFNSKRIFVRANALRDGDRFFGGYFVVFAGRDILPAFIMEQAQKSTNALLKRSFEKPANDRPWLLSDSSLLPSELSGYASLFADSIELPERIYVSKNLESEYKDYKGFNDNLSLFKKLLLLFAFVILLISSSGSLLPPMKLKRKLLLLTCFAVLLPYLILGYFSLSIMDSLKTLRENESEAELQRYIYQLEQFYQDHKKMQLFLLMFSKKQFVLRCNQVENLYDLRDHDFVQPNFFADFYMYRKDGAHRQFSYRHHGEIRSKRFLNQIAAKCLNNLGVLQTKNPGARKNLEMAGFTEGFVDMLNQNYLEHHIFSAEGYAAKDLTRIDDYSKVVHFLVPEAARVSSPIGFLTFAPVLDLNHNIYRPETFPDRVYEEESLFSTKKAMMGLRRLDDTVSRWWPDRVNYASELKDIMDFSAHTKSVGTLFARQEDGFKVSLWKFDRFQPVVFAGQMVGRPDLSMELAASAFPLVLFLFSLISTFLFLDILNAFFIRPIHTFVSAARLIREGRFSARINMAKSDELGELAFSFNKMAVGLEQKEKLARFVSDDLLQKIQDSSEAGSGQNLQKAEVCVLASDIRDFTSLSEKYDAAEVVRLLNDYFTAMEAVIVANSGTITRFIGDALIATFSGNQKSPAAVNASRAAMAMRLELAGLNSERQNKGLFSIENGIGIAVGEAVAGIAGSRRGRKVAMVIGSVVQRAEALEALSKQSGYKRIILDEEANQQCRNHFTVVPLAGAENAYDLIGEQH